MKLLSLLSAFTKEDLNKFRENVLNGIKCLLGQ